MVAVFQPSLHKPNIVQRESMLKVHVEIIFMHYKIMLFARTSLFIVCFMNISCAFRFEKFRANSEIFTLLNQIPCLINCQQYGHVLKRARCLER